MFAWLPLDKKKKSLFAFLCMNSWQLIQLSPIGKAKELVALVPFSDKCPKGEEPIHSPWSQHLR